MKLHALFHIFGHFFPNYLLKNIFPESKVFINRYLHVNFFSQGYSLVLNFKLPTAHFLLKKKYK